MVVLHYRPTQMERAYGSHLLQNQFHHDHHITDVGGDDDDREGSVHIPGRDAVPFLTTSGLDRAALRAIWTVVDPEGIGTLTRRSQFQIVLRLVAMAQSDLLPPILSDTSANDSALMLQDSLHKYQTLKVSLPTFSTIPMPTTAYLLSTYATKKSTSTTNADDSDQAIFNMAIDHDFQYKNWLKQQELQQQQQQQQQSLQNGMHVLSVSDAFGDLIHVQDMPLPSYNSQQQPPSPSPPAVEMDDNVFIPHGAIASTKGDVGTTDDTCDNPANSVHDGTTTLLSLDHATTDTLGNSSTVQHLPNDFSPEPENECVVPNETASPENECGNREGGEDDFGDFEGVVSDEANEESKVDDISQRKDVRVGNSTFQNGNHDLVVACVEKNIHEKEDDDDDHSFEDFVTADMGAQKGAFSSETAFNEDVTGTGDADDVLKAGGENDSDVNIMESSSSHPVVTEDVGQDGDGSVKDDDKATTMKESDKSTMRNWGVESDAALGLYIPSPDKVMGTSTNTLGLESFNPSASFFASSESVDSEGKRKTAMSMAMNDMRASKLSVFDSLVELDMQRASPAPVGGDHSKDDGLQRLETGTNSKGGSVPSDGSADERNVISDDHEDDFGDFDNGGEFNKQQIETQWGDVQTEGIAKGGSVISDEQKDEFGDFDRGGGGFGEPQGKNERGSVLSEDDAKGDDVRPDEDEDEFGDFDDGGAFCTSKREGDDLDDTFYSAQADGSSFSRATTPSLHVDSGDETRRGVGIPSSAQSAVTAPATSEPEHHVQPAGKAGLANKSFDSDFGDFADASDYAMSAEAETALHEKVNEGSGTYKAVEVILGLSTDDTVAENCGVVNSATGVTQSAVEVPCRLSVFDALVEADLANAELCKKNENTTKIGNMSGSSSAESRPNPSLFDGPSQDADVLPPCDDQSGVSVQLNANVTDSSTKGVFFTTQDIALPFPDSNKVHTTEETAEYQETGDEKKSTDSDGIAESIEMNGNSSSQKFHIQSSSAADGTDVRDSFSVMQQSESNANKLSVFDALVELDLSQANFTPVGGFFSDKDQVDSGQPTDAAVDSIAQADSFKPVINSKALEVSSGASTPVEESSRIEDLGFNKKPNDTGADYNSANFLAPDEEDDFADFGDFEGAVDSAGHSLMPSGLPVPHIENIQHEVSANGSSRRPENLSLELALNSNGVEGEYCGEIALAQTPEVRPSSPLHFPKEKDGIVEPISEKDDHDWNFGKNNDKGGTESDTEATETRLNGGAHMPKGDFSADHSSFEAEWGDFEGIGVEGDPSQPEFRGSEKRRELEDDNDEFGEWGDFGAVELPQQNDPSHLTVAGFPVGWDTNRIMSCSLSDLAELLFSVEMLEEALKVNDKGESIDERTLREWREKLCQYFADEPSQRTHLKLEEMRNRIISMEKELPASLRKPLVTETNDSSVSDIVSFSSNFQRFVGAGDEDNENSEFLPLGEQAKISPEVAIRRQVRAKRCLGLHHLLTTTHKQNVSHWEKIMSTAVDELAMARFLLQDMLDGTLSQEERSKIIKCNRVRIFVQGLGEYMRVVRSIVSTMGDLLCLDYNASWTEENLSSWGNFSFMQQAMEAEKLWTDIIAEVQRLHLTFSWTLERVEEMRNAISLKHHLYEGDLSQGICNLTLQPLVVEDSTKSRVFWDERPFMACAANFWSNRIALEAP